MDKNEQITTSFLSQNFDSKIFATTLDFYDMPRRKKASLNYINNCVLLGNNLNSALDTSASAKSTENDNLKQETKQMDASAEHSRQRKPRIDAVDLFCGAGGLTYGLHQAGISVKAGVDLDSACKYAYEENNHAEFIQKSVTDITLEDISKHFSKGAIKLLAGCAPCQTFSTYSLKRRAAESQNVNGRWFLLKEFARMVTLLKPELVTMENVPGLADQDVFESFKQTLKKEGYYVSAQIVDCVQYGIPQKRHRLVLLASKLGEIRLLSPEECNVKPQTVRDAIGGLPMLESGQKNATDPLHQCSRLSPLNLQRIRASKPGGTWRDWPECLVAKCHLKDTGCTYGSVYGRMSWDEPSPTMTTQFYGFGNGRFGHPDQDRAISLREGALLQTFPIDYQFIPAGQLMNLRQVGKMIGNAVPVKLGEIIGRSLVQHVKDNKQIRKKRGA